MTDEAPHCLVISDGRRGIENQALGLAEHCAALRPLKIQTHHIRHGKMLSAMPPKAQLKLAKFDLPECDMAIGCGRQAIAPLLYLKRSRPEVMTVYIQDPHMDPSAFDLVIAPEHDAVRGENVVTMIGAPNRITAAKLSEATRDFAAELSKFPATRAALLIGGTSKTHQLDLISHEAHMAAAQSLLSQGHSLLITTSRRTPEFAVLAWTRFASAYETVWYHGVEDPNPYFAFLGSADIILVTEDSTNMLTEACAAGAPVYRLPMAGHPGKFQNLYDSLETRCGVVPYGSERAGQTYSPLDETRRAAEQVWKHYERKL